MKTVATHDGGFHPDDAFAVACVMLLEGKENVTVIRSREKEVIDTCDWAVDTGREYDPERKRFDHHQPGALERENGIQYAAFGLMWKHYGVEICGSEEVATKINEKLVLPIDAHDVGVTLYEVNERDIHPAELFDVFYSFMPPWESGVDIDAQFLKAVDFAYDYLVRLIAQAEAKVAMKVYAAELYEQAEDKTVMVSERRVSASQFIEYGDVDAVACLDDNGSGNWTVTLVPIAKNSFSYRRRFPKAWGGLVAEELEEASGIKGAKFCHASGFFFLANSKDSALEATKHFE